MNFTRANYTTFCLLDIKMRNKKSFNFFDVFFLLNELFYEEL